MLLPAECLEQLKCFLCKRLLSRFPIYVAEDKDDQLLSICGRCEVPFDNKKYLRVTIYESVMKNVQFPCINRQQGCMEHLLPENIEQHELLCQYQTIKCKICDWNGQSFTVFDHYQTKHTDMILKNYKFKMNIKEDSNNSNILLHKETIFSFERNFDQNLKRIKCTLTSLFSTRSVKKYYAQINLIIDDIIMLKKFPEIDIDENEPKSIDIHIENMLNDSTEATGIINITNDIKEISIRTQHEENVPQSNFNIDMISLCTSMATFNTNLPTSSNHLLNLTYEPCQYGCGYTTLSAFKLKQHNNSCLNKQYNCLFICNENNQLRDCEEIISRKDLRTHIGDKHRADVAILTNSSPLIIEIETLTRKRYCKYLTDRRGNHFVLIIQHIEPHLFLWRVEVLESKVNLNNYTFKISMFNKDNNAELSMRASCAEFTCNKTYNISDTPCIWLHLEQLHPFINNNNTFSFNLAVYIGNEILG